MLPLLLLLSGLKIIKKEEEVNTFFSGTLWYCAHPPLPICNYDTNTTTTSTVKIYSSFRGDDGNVDDGNDADEGDGDGDGGGGNPRALPAVVFFTTELNWAAAAGRSSSGKQCEKEERTTGNRR